jgi:hypothetical protein
LTNVSADAEARKPVTKAANSNNALSQCRVTATDPYPSAVLFAFFMAERYLLASSGAA